MWTFHGSRAQLYYQSQSTSSSSSSSPPQTPASSSSSFFFSRYIINTGSRTDPGISVSPASCLKRGDWVGYTQCYPQQLLGRAVAWAIEPAFHWPASLQSVVWANTRFSEVSPLHTKIYGYTHTTDVMVFRFQHSTGMIQCMRKLQFKGRRWICPKMVKVSKIVRQSPLNTV